MADTSRVQRWREGKRKEGLEAMTIWLSPEEKARVADLAHRWHRSPSEILREAIAQFNPLSPCDTDMATDTTQLRVLLQEELATSPVVTDTVTEVVTAMLARDLPAMVRQLVEGLALEALGLPITDTNGNVADTEPPGEVTTRPAPQRKRGAMHQRILTVLQEHSEGLSDEQIRSYSPARKTLGRYAPRDGAGSRDHHARGMEA